MTKKVKVMTKEELKNKVIQYQDSISYINLNKNNSYKGWVTDFHIRCDNIKIKLDFKKEKDLFLLFVLALVWTIHGYWENAAYFVAYLKGKGKEGLDDPKNWKNIKFVEKQKEKITPEEVSSCCSGVETRVGLSFQDVYFDSILVIAQNWEVITNLLEEASKKKNEVANEDYQKFIKYMRELKVFGSKNRHMKIKILLILRELKCQGGIYKNIPGELCCVPDKRAREAAIKLFGKGKGKALPSDFIQASKRIYNDFGDLYDIPLFAYEDIKKEDEKNKS